MLQYTKQECFLDAVVRALIAPKQLSVLAQH